MAGDNTFIAGERGEKGDDRSKDGDGVVLGGKSIPMAILFHDDLLGDGVWPPDPVPDLDAASDSIADIIPAGRLESIADMLWVVCVGCM